MKKIFFGLALWLVGAVFGVSVCAAQNPISDQLRAQWESSRKQMTQISDAMPADKFDYRPVPEVRSFGEIVSHFAAENTSWMEVIEGTSKVKTGAEFEEMTKRFDGLKTKPEIMKALSDSYDYGARVLARLNDQKAMTPPDAFGMKSPMWAVIMNDIGHTKEHYGNLVTYLRMNHIVPPASR